MELAEGASLDFVRAWLMLLAVLDAEATRGIPARRQMML